MRIKVLVVGLRGTSFERASWGGELESVRTRGCSTAGTRGTGVFLVSEPSGLGEILRNSYGSMAAAAVRSDGLYCIGKKKGTPSCGRIDGNGEINRIW